MFILAFLLWNPDSLFSLLYINEVYSVLVWYKSNCGFKWLHFAVWYWNSVLNKYGYVIDDFNEHFSLYFFLLMTLVAVYIYFRL